jgi:hypothetical protein
MLKFAVSASRIFRPDSAIPPKTYSPKCLEGLPFAVPGCFCPERGSGGT